MKTEKVRRLSYHKRSFRWYKKVDGKFFYFGPSDRNQEQHALAFGLYEQWAEKRQQGQATVLKAAATAVNPQTVTPTAPQKQISAAPIIPTTAPQATPSALSPGLTLKQLASEWGDFQDSAKVLSGQHKAQTRRLFKEFADKCNNIKVKSLTRENMVSYRDWLTCNKSKVAAVQRCRVVKLVLNWGYERQPDALPVGYRDMLGLLKINGNSQKKVKQVKTFDGEPMPAELFKALYRVTTTTEQKALLLITANCGLDGGDIKRLTWGHIQDLDGKNPRLQMVRAKVLWRVDNPDKVTRVIPLAAETVKQVKTLKEERGWRATDNHLIFYSNRGTAWGQNAISNCYNKLKAAVKDKSPFTAKHLRNVGPNCGNSINLPLQKIDQFLGHCVGSVAAHYLTTEKLAADMMPIVDEIEKKYFKGLDKKK